MLEWCPQSMLGQNWTRPRVYLIDFEVAIHFLDGISPFQRLTSGLPLPGDDYSRQWPPELLTSDMYCPFRLESGYVAIRFPIGADVFCKSVLTIPQLWILVYFLLSVENRHRWDWHSLASVNGWQPCRPADRPGSFSETRWSDKFFPS